MHDWTSMVGNKKKRVLTSIPEKFPQILYPQYCDTIVQIWKVILKGVYSPFCACRKLMFTSCVWASFVPCHSLILVCLFQGFDDLYHTFSAWKPSLPEVLSFFTKASIITLMFLFQPSAETTYWNKHFPTPPCMNEIQMHDVLFHNFTLNRQKSGQNCFCHLEGRI